MEDVVIVGAGIAGLTTSLGLHRLGVRSLVLESADSLRTTGFALGIWTNGWKVLDALAIGDILRAKHHKLNGVVTTSANSGINTSEISFTAIPTLDDLELRCVNRKTLLEVLEDELPKGTIRYSSKVVHIETEDCVNSIHLADGTVLKTKVLIGCDGVNSMVSKFLGFSKPSYTGRTSVRGLVFFKDGHGFEPKLMLFFGKGIRFGVVPCDDHQVYWFFSLRPSSQEKQMVEDPTKLKLLILSKLGKVSDDIRQVFEKTESNNMASAPLRSRYPWEMIWGNISKDNVCVIGDALHPMTPDLAQAGCCALEDGLVLARHLGKAFKEINDMKQWHGKEYEEKGIGEALEKMAKERRWRSFDLITTSYIVGLMLQSDGVFLQFLRDRFLAKFLAGVQLKRASFDCGNLHES